MTPETQVMNQKKKRKNIEFITIKNLYIKEDYQQSKKATQRIGENICKSYIQ